MLWLCIQNKLLAQGILQSLRISHLTIFCSHPSLVWPLDVSLIGQEKSLNTLTHKVGQCILVFTCPLLPDCNIPVTAIIVANMGGM